MVDVPNESVHLVITSPPYWQLKDYGNHKRAALTTVSDVRESS